MLFSGHSRRQMAAKMRFLGGRTKVVMTAIISNSKGRALEKPRESAFALIPECAQDIGRVC